MNEGMSERINEWMNEWMNQWMDEWMNEDEYSTLLMIADMLYISEKRFSESLLYSLLAVLWFAWALAKHYSLVMF